MPHAQEGKTAPGQTWRRKGLEPTSAYSKHGSTHTYRTLHNQSQMPIKQYNSLKAHYFESPVNYKNVIITGSSFKRYAVAPSPSAN